jgi:hypothetical protein
MLKTLRKLWEGLGTPVEEQVAVLASLLDVADYSPGMNERFETSQSKMSAQLQIMQLATRKDFLEFRLRCLNRLAEKMDEGQSGITRQRSPYALI